MNIGVIQAAETFASERMKGYEPGHDWSHIARVRKMAAHINSIEKSADPFILDIASILHDVADSKFRKMDMYPEVGKFLIDVGLQDEKDHIIEIIRNISFSNGNPSGNLKDPVFQILQDADRLDAIGAIGIARAFSYGSFAGNPIYSPPDRDGSMDPSTIRHFYDKLLKLKGLMNTATGRELADERHIFLELFLKQFYSEWKI